MRVPGTDSGCREGSWLWKRCADEVAHLGLFSCLSPTLNRWAWVLLLFGWTDSGQVPQPGGVKAGFLLTWAPLTLGADNYIALPPLTRSTAVATPHLPDVTTKMTLDLPSVTRGGGQNFLWVRTTGLEEIFNVTYCVVGLFFFFF